MKAPGGNHFFASACAITRGIGTYFGAALLLSPLSYATLTSVVRTFLRATYCLLKVCVSAMLSLAFWI